MSDKPAIPSNPSREFIRLNQHLFGIPSGEAAGRKKLVLRLTGQVRGGKNGMGVTKSGRHYAREPFKIWRSAACAEIRRQLPAGWIPIKVPCDIRLDYVAGDHRRRDEPAIKDAIWHVLERASVVADDALLWTRESTRSFDKDNPGCIITFL